MEAAAGMNPAGALRCFAAGALAGAALGLLRGALAPLGRRHRHMADGLICLGAGAVWLELTFVLLRGDPRLGAMVGAPLGFGLWEWGPGQLLAPVWAGVWEGIWKILDIFPRAGKKVWIFFKFLLSIRRKIGYNRRQIEFAVPSPSGGSPMEPKPKRKIVIRPGSRALKVLCAIVLTLALLALGASWYVRRDIARMTEEKRQQAAALEEENQTLEEKKEALGSVDSVQEIAREELGYVDPGAVVIGEK